MGARRMRKSVTARQYLTVSCLVLSLALSISHISDMRHEKQVILRELEELAVMEIEREALADLVAGYQEELSRLEKNNAAMEELLLNRARTYLSIMEWPLEERETNLMSRSGGHDIGRYENAISMPLNTPSGLTPADFEHIWRLYRAKHLKNTGTALIQAEQEYRVNALALAAIIAHESAWGRSAIAIDKNNLAGLGAYDGSPYASAMAFCSKNESIMYLAALLSQDYLVEDGRHYRGPDLRGVGRNYASDPYWSRKVAYNMRLLVTAALDNPEAVLGYIYAVKDNENN